MLASFVFIQLKRPAGHLTLTVASFPFVSAARQRFCVAPIVRFLSYTALLCANHLPIMPFTLTMKKAYAHEKKGMRS